MGLALQSQPTVTTSTWFTTVLARLAGDNPRVWQERLQAVQARAAA